MLLDKLRRATQADHQALEQELAIAGPSLTLDIYRRELSRLWGFYASWEPLMVSWTEEWVPHGRERLQKTRWLSQDLVTLGMTAAQLTQLPAIALPNPASFWEALGSLYVVEGSTLGGQWLSRHVEQSLGLTHGRGYSFFMSYGDSVGPMWREFVEFLLDQSSPVADGEIIKGAVATFRDVRAWLSRVEAAA